MAILLGIDLGTSYFKVGLFDATGALKGIGRVVVEKRTPTPGRCELPVEVFWLLLRRALGEALAQAGAKASQILALSYSSQANTFVLLDRRAAPLTPLVLWTDSRGNQVEERLTFFSHTKAFRRTAGFEGITGQSAVAKWRWFQKHEPALWARAHRLMTISDYFTFALTGEPVGDASSAALLGLYDLHARDWWTDALAAFDVEAKKLSTPLRPASPCGRTVSEAADLLGVPAGIPFAVGGLDHHVAAVGAGLDQLADLSISTGTVLAALGLVDLVTPRRGCFHGPHVDGTRYYRLAFDPAGAGQLEDYQRCFAPNRSIAQLIALAARVPPGSGSPAEPRSGGMDTNRGVAVRRLLEKIGATHRELVRQVAGRHPVHTIVATGGGARSPVWLQIMADMLEVPIAMPSCVESACLGAAAFAAAAAGVYSDVAKAVLGMVHPKKILKPNPQNVAIYREKRWESARAHNR